MANQQKQKKLFYKKWWVWAIAIVIIVAATSGRKQRGKQTNRLLLKLQRHSKGDKGGTKRSYEGRG